MDVSSDDDVKNAFNTISKDVRDNNLAILSLINNAGYGYASMLEQQDEKATRANFETNVFGLINFTNTFLPLIRSQKHLLTQRSNQKLNPTIIIVSSIAGTLVMPYYSIYSATKFACESIGDAYRIELAKQGINVVLVKPGQIATKFFDRKDMAPKDDIPSDLVVEAKKSSTSPIERYYTYGILSINKLLRLLLNTNGSQPELVFDIYEEAILTPNPHARYIVGPDAQLGAASFYHIGDQGVDIPMLDKFVPIETFND